MIHHVEQSVAISAEVVIDHLASSQSSSPERESR